MEDRPMPKKGDIIPAKEIFTPKGLQELKKKIKSSPTKSAAAVFKPKGSNDTLTFIIRYKGGRLLAHVVQGLMTPEEYALTQARKEGISAEELEATMKAEEEKFDKEVQEEIDQFNKEENGI